MIFRDPPSQDVILLNLLLEGGTQSRSNPMTLSLDPDTSLKLGQELVSSVGLTSYALLVIYGHEWKCAIRTE